MPRMTISLYETIVVNGFATGDSRVVELQINDLDGNGAINRTEWLQYVGGTAQGHVAGNTSPPALFKGATGNVMNGTLYTPVSFTRNADLRTLLQDLSKSKYEPSVDALNICFLAGTLIATPNGDVPVETLRAGDVVLTRDHGPQVLVWTDSSLITSKDLDRAPNRRAVRIEAGALGDGLPHRDLLVSAQHRLLVKGADGQEYLVAARQLIMAGYPGVSVARDLTEFELVHIAFATHEIVSAEGAPAESFYTGEMALHGLSPLQRIALTKVFPALLQGQNPMVPARPFATHRELAALGQTASA